MIALSESQVKQAVEEYLQYGQNQGKWFFLRLNSGEAIVKRGDKSYKMQLCPKGTADFIVIQGGEVQMFNAIQKKIHKTHPVCFVTFVECKSTNGKQSPEQIEFEDRIKKLHCKYVIVRNSEELEEALRYD